MIRPWIHIFFVFLFAGLPYLAATAEKIEHNSNSTCRSVGIVLQTSDSILQNKLCKHGQLKVNSKALIACRYKSITQWLSAGIYEVNRICPADPSSNYRCLLGEGCFRGRIDIYLIGQTFAFQETNPRLRWTPVENAVGYSLLIQSSDGKEIYRERVTIPEYQFTYALRPGKLYEIDIEVTGGKISEKFAIQILSPEHITEMNSMIEIINTGSWTEIEKALYRDGVYTRFGLVLEAIDNLEQSPELKQSRELQERLAGVYIDAGYFEKARKIFDALHQKMSGDDSDFQSQLPTSTKFPQL